MKAPGSYRLTSLDVLSLARPAPFAQIPGVTTTEVTHD